MKIRLNQDGTVLVTDAQIEAFKIALRTMSDDFKKENPELVKVWQDAVIKLKGSRNE